MSLPDGAATLQWVYFGGGAQLADYYSCADIIVQGGAGRLFCTHASGRIISI